jgi:hypothetical protein
VPRGRGKGLDLWQPPEGAGEPLFCIATTFTADEVGMGKTFVALAVAVSVVLDRPHGGPVVVMVPPSLREERPKDWTVFTEKCLSPGAPPLRCGRADSGVGFLRLLDDPPDRAAHVIFLTHGALYRSLTDGYAKLAVIRRAFKKRTSLDNQRRNFPRFAGRLLRMEASVERRAPGLLGDLLESPYEHWLRVIQKAHPQLREEVTDDPVPLHLREALESFSGAQLNPLVDALRDLPLKESAHIEDRLRAARQALADVMKDIWNLALREAKFRSPLLILDEAHHLKNPATRLASLFVDEEAASESEQFEARGALGGKFERMLFLTATPFQLGHHELVRVIERFDGIAWDGPRAPRITRAECKSDVADLAETLDAAQASALRLDRVWGRLTSDHMADGDGRSLDPEQWWRHVATDGAEGIAGEVVEQVNATRSAMRAAEEKLRPWVLRHVKDARLPTARDVDRRRILPGAAILDPTNRAVGLEIGAEVLLPFLLAGRAQALLAATRKGRALFAEGLASSFVACVETRARKLELDEDAVELDGEHAPELRWYLGHLDRALPREERATWEAHPKVRATAACVVDLWKHGEKSLVFCHYRATGRALRRHISALLGEEIARLAAAQLGREPGADVRDELDRIADRFFESDAPLRRAVTESVGRIVERFPTVEREHGDQIVDVVRRFLRTPSFLVRHFDLSAADRAAAFAAAVERSDVGGLSLRERIEHFCRFLEGCIPDERKSYLEALSSIQTGRQSGREVAATFDKSEIADEAEGLEGRELALPKGRRRRCARCRERGQKVSGTPGSEELIPARRPARSPSPGRRRAARREGAGASRRRGRCRRRAWR